LKANPLGHLRVVSSSWGKTVHVEDAHLMIVHLKATLHHIGCMFPTWVAIVSGSRDTTIRMGDAVTDEMVAGPFEGHVHWVTSAAYSPDRKRIISDKTVRV
jgi:WD40 repeat protein